METINDLEGTEVVTAKRTRTGYSVSVGGNVKSSLDIPRSIKIRTVYMGEALSIEIPFRTTVQQNQIKFQLIDDGAVETATASAQNRVTQIVREALEDSQVVLYMGRVNAK